MDVGKWWSKKWNNFTDLMYNGIIKNNLIKLKETMEKKIMTIYDILKGPSNGGNWKIIDINK